MNVILKKYPVPITGLILGLASVGNLVQSYGEIYRNIFGFISAILFSLMLIKIFRFTDGIRENLQNPVTASVFPTFSMAAMLLATYIKPMSQPLALLLWVIGVVLHIALIIWFSMKFIINFKIKQVFPSWFVVYVGIVVASLTAPAFNMHTVGQAAFWFGFVTYFALLPVVLYRIVKIKEMPEPTLPTLIIFAAPASLLLAGYINVFETKQMEIVLLLTSLSLIMYAVALAILPKLLKLKFYPSYSAFTFPMIISGIAIKLTNGFFIKSGNPVSWLIYIIKAQETIAVVLTVYVLIRYLKYLLVVTQKQPA